MLRQIVLASARYSKPLLSSRVTSRALSYSKQVRLTPCLQRSFHFSPALSNSYKATELTTERYHRLSDEVLDHIVGKLEEMCDELDLPGFDVEYSQGVMTISVGEHGTYVVNKQPPNHQIWLSSPVSGPQRFDYDEKHQRWFYHRDNHTLEEVLNKELSEALKQPIDLLAGYDPKEQ
ncbi:Frataxin [Choanephora cucurbitarum]|nr:Frataxin [Choanephora cucurbitarum]